MLAIRRWWTRSTPEASFVKWLSIGLISELSSLIVLLVLMGFCALSFVGAAGELPTLLKVILIESGLLNMGLLLWLVQKFA